MIRSAIICPECNKEKKSHFDKEAIRLLRRCVDCKIAWENRPENDPENNKYVIQFSSHSTDECTIYAKSKEEAKDEFYNGGYADDDDCEIDSISETTREELNERYAAALKKQTQEAMGQPAI